VRYKSKEPKGYYPRQTGTEVGILALFPAIPLHPSGGSQNCSILAYLVKKEGDRRASGYRRKADEAVLGRCCVWLLSEVLNPMFQGAGQNLRFIMPQKPLCAHHPSVTSCPSNNYSQSLHRPGEMHLSLGPGRLGSQRPFGPSPSRHAWKLSAPPIIHCQLGSFPQSPTGPGQSLDVLLPPRSLDWATRPWG
jgi:hypothetical protein